MVFSILLGGPNNLTGEYVGSYNCSWVDNAGLKGKKKIKESVLNILHDDISGLIAVDIDGTHYCGRVIQTSESAEKGIGILIKTETSDVPVSSNGMDYFTWKTKGKANIKRKIGIYTSAGEIGTCKGGWKREAFESDPGVMLPMCGGVGD